MQAPKTSFLSVDSSRLWRAVLFVAMAGLLLSLPIGSAAQDDSTPDATVAGVLGDAVATDSCNLDDYAAAPDGTVTLYRIVSDESEVRYLAEEELASIGATTAVGSTSAFIGQIGLDESGVPLICSRFDADLRTLTSDESMRDNYLYNNTLETGTYPLATFILTDVEGIDGALVDGEETEVTLIGNLTIHGVTKLVAWTGTVTLSGDTLAGSAEMSFQVEDFGMEEPQSRMVVSIDDTITLQVDIVAQLSEG